MNALTHLIGAAVALAWGAVMLAGAFSWVMAFYVFCIVTMLSVSGLYHTVTKSSERIFLWRRLDHICIYLLIAGGYTVFCVIALPTMLGYGILIAVWVLFGLGLAMKTLWFGAPKALSLGVYLGMGWLAVLMMPALYTAHGAGIVTGIAAGGGFYTVGAVVYGLRKPNWVPGVFGFHELWHLFVLGGAYSHLWTAQTYLIPLL